MRPLALLALLALGCGDPPGASSDGGAAADAAPTDGAAPDATSIIDAGEECPIVPEPGQGQIFVDVSLANFERDLLGLEVVRTAGTGSFCVVRRPPASTIVTVDGVVGSIYELRFTANGYVPFTYPFEVTPELVEGGGFHLDPVVMVRGAVLGPTFPSPLPLQDHMPGRFGVRPGSDDLFFGIDDTWRVARRTSTGIAVSELDVVAPTVGDYLEAPSFTPDGQVAFLATAPAESYDFTCVAVNAATGEVLAAGLSAGHCTDGARPVFAALGQVGLAPDESRGELVVFTWTGSSYRETQRLSEADRFQRVLDAAGTHALREDDRANPLIRDLASGADAAPTRDPDAPSRTTARVLGASGTFTIHANGGGFFGGCDAAGCDVAIEPIGRATVPVVTGASAWAASPVADALVYVAGGELHHYDVTTATDRVVDVSVFDATFHFEDAFVVTGAAGLQAVEISTGAIRLTVPGSFELEPDARDPGVRAASPLLLRVCREPDCEVAVVDLRAFTRTPSHDHPFQHGARAWFEDAASERAVGPAALGTGRWPFFARAGSEMDPVASTAALADFPCVPFVWREQWICAE